ncbi:MAG: hypothetical protein KGL95_16020 [Patescibacteria group bacterium]|nr:hypothetical protein [Patescibacteria group bacterium]
MKTLHLAIMAFFTVTALLVAGHEASAHIVPPFYLQYDQGNTDPPTHPLLTKEGAPLFILTRHSSLIIPLAIKDYHGRIKLAVSFYVTPESNMTKAASVEVVPNQVLLNDTRIQSVSVIVKPSQNATFGKYRDSIVASYKDGTYNTNYGAGSITFLVEDNSSKVPPPLKQFISGVTPYQIQCRYPLVLFFKSSDHLPICLSVTTEERLEQRGYLDMNTGPYMDLARK